MRSALILLFTRSAALCGGDSLYCAAVDPRLARIGASSVTPRVLCRAKGSVVPAPDLARQPGSPMNSLFLHSSTRDGQRVTGKTTTCSYRSGARHFVTTDSSCDPLRLSNKFTMPSKGRIYFSDVPYTLREVVPYPHSVLCKIIPGSTVFTSDEPFWRVAKGDDNGDCRFHVQRSRSSFSEMAVSASSSNHLLRFHDPVLGVAYGFMTDMRVGDESEIVLLTMELNKDGKVQFAVLRMDKDEENDDWVRLSSDDSYEEDPDRPPTSRRGRMAHSAMKIKNWWNRPRR
ncbi:hypothetical protein FOZ61_008202 [Perkinsus olseni]|uniref:DUF1618 domain-containing protein n=1 Tax=Perkinsus olseni TaxID=32597 RepID=A0A7J6LCX4_PEROL|nr:hypothetical protein FOZ61_008202 [Perkinsus olseni]KAF4657084.1 hypothetical protein FOL46_007575 [Perkinsus olseni]